MKFYYYKINNIENGSFYIGITTDYIKREKQHFDMLRRNAHPNYKLQADYNKYGKEKFIFSVIDSYEGNEQDAYQKEYDLIQFTNATQFYNILEGGHLNPVYTSQVLEKIKKSHQEKYDNILQYEFDGKHFTLIKIYGSIRDAAKLTGCDFRAIQNSLKTTQAHHNYYWVKENEKEKWLNVFLKRHTCCVAKINEQTKEIEDTALTIKEFAERYNTTYNKIYHSLKRGDRCERKYKFIRITANQFAEINNLSL